MRRLGDIGVFIIGQETAIASGIRRIEAFTGEAALEFIAARDSILQATTDLLKVSADDVLVAWHASRRPQNSTASLPRRPKNWLWRAAVAGAGTDDSVRELAGINGTRRWLAAKQLRGLVDEGKTNRQRGGGFCRH